MENVAAVDCLVVGGGPAGLTAATYLGRFRRSVVVVDGGESRLKSIPLSHNIPGFPEGVSGEALHGRMVEQAVKYGARLLVGRVEAIHCEADGFVISSSAGVFFARCVLLATGVDVAPPPLADIDAAVAKGLVRYCPICDGFEAMGSRVAVLGGRPHSIEEALFLKTYVDDLTFVTMNGAPVPPASEIAKARWSGVKVELQRCVAMATTSDAVQLHFDHGDTLNVDIVYPCLGTEPRSELARMLGAGVSEEGELLTDRRQETNVPGLFAAGDVLRGLDQVASACGQAAIAATAMHNRLRA